MCGKSASEPLFLYLAKRTSDWRFAKIPVQVYLSSVMAPFQKTTLWQQENFDLKLSGTPAPYGTVANMHHSRRITLRDWGWFLDRTRGWFSVD